MSKKLLLLFIIPLTYCSEKGPDLTNALASVNNRTITEQDFIDQARSVSTFPGNNLSTRDSRIVLLKGMIDEELVFQQALKEQYHLKNISIKHDIVKAYLQQKFGGQLPDNLAESKIEKFYTDNQGIIDRIRANHILIKTNKDDKSTIPVAKQKIEQVRSEIVSGKISFEEAAKKYSDDEGTRKQGGDLNFFVKGQMVGQFSDTAFGLKKIGEVSQPVETEYGFHIIQLTADQRGLDYNKDKIRWKLYQDEMQPTINDFFTKLRENAKVQMMDGDITALSIPQF